jgi:hypothetical protein
MKHKERGTKRQQIVMFFLFYKLYSEELHNVLLPPFRIIVRLTFPPSTYSNNYADIILFVMTCFINKKSFKNDLNLTMFAFF